MDALVEAMEQDPLPASQWTPAAAKAALDRAVKHVDSHTREGAEAKKLGEFLGPLEKILHTREWIRGDSEIEPRLLPEEAFTAAATEEHYDSARAGQRAARDPGAADKALLGSIDQAIDAHSTPPDPEYDAMLRRHEKQRLERREARLSRRKR
jgi:hypothetical protein